MTKLYLVIDGEPTAKRRPKIASRGKKAMAYSDQKKEEALFIAYILAQLPDGHTPLEGPLRIDAIFYKSRPKSHYGTGRNAGKLKKSAPSLPETTPDLDNYLKWINDCMNDVVFADDRQIVDSSEKKRYSRQPRTEITIETIYDQGGKHENN